ncbi:hypothetical protein DDZ13_04130 [Coraliomargarita sinensis]|uniref:Type II secretion system protein GspE N-terminal domain-containing protein n=1 Tax=Coraliomargarita sinensis TaxID=2174842 RepID=A0A317ZHW2_9BACT|nr:hypothetical protein [Coraliomargarita sinensis]PXA05156.1 hypothetical protein DDZ13_04130 [Coraliomargarita sinensis]
MQEHRALILRSNRFLGSAMVERGLVSVDDLEAANEKFMEAIQASELKRASILSTLLYETKALEEQALLEHLVEEESLGLIDLGHIDLRSLRPYNVDLSLCWATSTIPFDKVENTYMLATCYWLSAPVVKHWEELLDGRVIWYGTATSSMTRALEQIEEIHEAEDEAAAEDE